MINRIKKRKVKQNKDSLNLILELTQTINQGQTIDDLLYEFKRILLEELGIEKVLVYNLFNEKWSIILSASVDDKEIEKIDVEKDLMPYQDITNLTFASENNLNGFDAAIPLFLKEKIIGYVLIGDLEEKEGISPTIKHLVFIQIISNIIVIFIENKRMHNILLEQEAFKREMELASRIQNQLIPNAKELPNHKNISIHTVYLPHLGVGGDYYDFIQLSKNTIGFCIADVSGKGIAAAILMSNFQAILRTFFTKRVSFKKLISLLNRRVNSSANNEKFITMFIGKYNFITRQLTYVNAGHLPPLLYNPNKNQLVSLDKGCIGLGMLDHILGVEVGKITIDKKSKLIAFTDGLVELEKGDEITNKLSFLKKSLSTDRTLNENFQDFRDFIAENYNRKQIFDDISLIGMEFY